MSQENVEIVRGIYAAWERDDFDAADWAAPDIEFVIADGPAPGSWSGLARMADGFRDSIRPWENWTVTAEENRALDQERVLVLQHYGGRGKESGLDIEQTRSSGANLFHVRAGRVTRLVSYMDRTRAPEAVGLVE